MRAAIFFLGVFLGGQVAATNVYVDKGACPGEGCQYGERWVAKESVELRKEPDAKSPITGRVPSGASVRTVTGEVHTVPVRFIVRVAHDGFAPGDEVLVYTYLGEGHFRVRHNGTLREADLDFGPAGGSGGTRCQIESRCWGTLQREHESTWSIQVPTDSGVEGWTLEGLKFLTPSQH